MRYKGNCKRGEDVVLMSMVGGAPRRGGGSRPVGAVGSHGFARPEALARECVKHASAREQQTRLAAFAGAHHAVG